MTVVQSWEKYLQTHRLKDTSNMCLTLNEAGVREALIWCNRPGRYFGEERWSDTWSDIVQIASQVLKDN